MRAHFNKVAKFFSEEPSSAQIDEFFGSFGTFIADFEVKVYIIIRTFCCYCSCCCCYFVVVYLVLLLFSRELNMTSNRKGRMKFRDSDRER